MNRSAGFGYGLKFDFTKNASKNPGPEAYKIDSIFSSQNSGKTRGPSIGLGREVNFTKIKNKIFYNNYERLI
jgi:hypothetical protein